VAILCGAGRLHRARLLTPRCQQGRRSMAPSSTAQLEQDMQRDAIAWFGIPATNLDRARCEDHALIGQASTPRTALPPGMGFVAQIVGPEGNRVGLHALA
jgi:hypothetical protein